MPNPSVEAKPCRSYAFCALVLWNNPGYRMLIGKEKLPKTNQPSILNDSRENSVKDWRAQKVNYRVA